MSLVLFDASGRRDDCRAEFACQRRNSADRQSAPYPTKPFEASQASYNTTMRRSQSKRRQLTPREPKDKTHDPPPASPVRSVDWAVLGAAAAKSDWSFLL